MGTSGDHPNYNSVEIGQNTEKSPGDLSTLVVTQTPMRNHQLTLLGKTLKGVNNSAEQWIVLSLQTTD